MRVEISDGWSASEFSELFAQLNFLYEAARFGQVRIDGQSAHPFMPWWFRRRRWPEFAPYYDEESLEDEAILRHRMVERMLSYASSEKVPSPKLEVRRIEFASPGFVDVAGVGKVVKELRLFMTGILDRYLNKEDRKIARQAAAQDLLAKKIMNAENLLKLGEKAGLDPETRQSLVREILTADYYVEGKFITGKITNVK